MRERVRKEKSLWGRRGLGQYKEMGWEEAGAGRLGGKREDLMNVDHCPST